MGLIGVPGGEALKLGLLTAAFPRLSLQRVAAWAAGNGFEMLEIACWPGSGGERRRYAGVSHIDAAKPDPERVRSLLGEHGLEISSLAYYPNNLHPDARARKAANDHLKRVIDVAASLDVPIVGTFVGRDQTKNVPDNFREFRRVWPRLVAHAEGRGVKIAIENCPMIFSHDEWPGGTNLAATPAVWDEMFSIVDSDAFGLNLDPSHLVWLMIDPQRVVRDYASKIFHVHAKDLEIDRDGLYRHGTISLGMGWQVPRLPGLGEVSWDRFLAALYRSGYDYVVSIEHEDRTFEGSEELVKRGFLIARDVLRPHLH
jgi:sugar phosphate isomerase/epimerase